MDAVDYDFPIFFGIPRKNLYINIYIDVNTLNLEVRILCKVRQQRLYYKTSNEALGKRRVYTPL